MHFWIDKRSQQCGFGRSRVAASLSASSGVGLGFGHPPRRMHSGNKSSSTSMNVPNSNTLTSIHGTSRMQQHHQQQQQSFGTPSTTTYAVTTTDCYNTSRNCHQQQQQLSNNNNMQGYVASNSNLQQQQHTQQHNNVNNNPHQQQFNNINASAGSATSSTITNNNHQSRYGGISTAGSLHQHHNHHYQHEMRYHHPQFGNMSVRHYQPMSSASTSGSNSIGSNVDTRLQHCSVEVTTSGVTQCNNVGSAASNVAFEQQRQNHHHRMQQQQPAMPGLMPHTYGTVLEEIQTGATTGARSSFIHSQNQQQQQQQQQQHQSTLRQSMNHTNTPHRAIYSSQCTRANAFNSGNIASFTNTSSNSNSNNNNNDNSNAAAVTYTADAGNHHHNHQYHHNQQQQQQPQQQQQQQQQHQHVHHRQLHTLIDHSETQLLPSHLKSGVCASLILASIFVAAAKFYFDHQNSGLEVLIFIAFSMTFLLAACTVSLCRIPKGMIVQRPTSLHGEHGARNATVCTAALSVGDGGVAGGGNIINRNDVMAMSSACQQVLFARPLVQEHALAAQAGPPPYHIAILLPENACKEEEESPPPSYDKILI